MPAVQPIVFVVDDDPSVRSGLDSLLRSAGWRVETFPSAAAFLARQPEDAPSCLVLDVSLPGLSGMQLQDQLNDAQVELPIVFITGAGDIPTSVRAMKAGAMEFLTKPFHDADLLAGVERALARSRDTRREATTRAEVRQRFETLSARERQVLELVVAGRLNKQIAIELGVQEVTVKAHRGRVMRKMQAPSLADLVRMGELLKRRVAGA